MSYLSKTRESLHVFFLVFFMLLYFELNFKSGIIHSYNLVYIYHATI